MNFADHFSDEQLLRRLCHYRIKGSQRRHEEHRLRNISGAAPTPLPLDDFEMMFPPRSAWLRPRRSERPAGGRSEVNEVALFRAVTGLRSPTPGDATWTTGLREYAEGIRARALDQAAVLTTPVVQPKQKSSHVYRVISVYPIQERILIGQTTRYLGRRFDEQLVNEVYGQRMGYRTQSRTHHDAVEALVSYRERHAGKRLWVAECDLRGFFDCMPHQAVRDALHQAADRARRRGRHVDDRAIQVAEAYLQSYSFTSIAAPRAIEWLQAHDPMGRLDIPTEELNALWGPQLPADLGIAQGGALSGLLANLVLDRVDRAALGTGGASDPDLFYCRYVDDILIVHPDRHRCEEVHESLLRALAELRLPAHPPSQFRDYTRRFEKSGKNIFWSYKSRAPYLWEGKDKTKRSVPWVAFLGYQVRFDGLLRIRPASIAKQLVKQVAEVDTIFRVLRPRHAGRNLNVSPARALKSFVFRMNAISGGRRVGARVPGGWTGGFRLLKGRPHVKAQIRTLDRGRGQQLRRLVRGVRTYTGFSPDAPFLAKLRRASTTYAAQLEGNGTALLTLRLTDGAVHIDQETDLHSV